MVLTRLGTPCTHSYMVHTFADVIDKFGGPAAFAREVGMTAGAAKQAKRRGSINAKWFRPTAQAAQKCGFEEITESKLAELASRQEAA